MDRKHLDIIQAELDRFQSFLNAAKERSDNEKGWTSTYGNDIGKVYGMGEISGTKESGSLKRAALDLKRLLTKYL